MIEPIYYTQSIDGGYYVADPQPTRLTTQAQAPESGLRDVLLRNGFVECENPGCNCGSWHARYGYRELFEEFKDALAGAGHPTCNANGNIALKALQQLIAERDSLLAVSPPSETAEPRPAQAEVIGELIVDLTTLSLKFPSRSEERETCRSAIAALGARNTEREQLTHHDFRAVSSAPAIEPAQVGDALAALGKAISALKQIERWELPTTSEKWPDGSPMSYGALYGSNGERDYIRSIARAALTTPPAIEPAQGEAAPAARGEAWQLVRPDGAIAATDSSCMRCWARIGGYKPTVENLLAYEEQGWRVRLAAPPAIEPAQGAAEPIKLNIIRRWPEGFEARLQDVWLDVVSFIPNVKLYDLQRVLAEFGFTMTVTEATSPTSTEPKP